MPTTATTSAINSGVLPKAATVSKTPRKNGLTFAAPFASGPVAELVGIEVGVVSGVMNLESSGVEAPDRRPRHGQVYHEA